MILTKLAMGDTLIVGALVVALTLCKAVKVVDTTMELMRGCRADLRVEFAFEMPTACLLVMLRMVLVNFAVVAWVSVDEAALRLPVAFLILFHPLP